MEPTDVEKMMNATRKLKVRKPYVAPQLERMSPHTAKDLLLPDADRNDPELRQMIERIDQLHGAKGS
jgi:hypothetical protein